VKSEVFMQLYFRFCG